MTPLTRRAFLELAAKQSLAASLAATSLLAACRSTAEQASALGLDRSSTKTLIALMDEIIPASDAMPAASQAGTLAYFELLATADSGLPETIQGALRAVNAPSSSAGTTIAAGLEKSDRPLFARLRTYVYEGYYLQPQIWKQLGYQPYPTSGPGPVMAPFRPALLDRVKAMPKRYRTV
jgi:hypothetical protein